MQDQAMGSPESSNVSIITNTKAPNVFASPHFRTKTNATRLPFKEFQKKVINNPPNLSANQNHTDPLFASSFSKKSENESKEITNEQFIFKLPNFSKESIENLSKETFNKEKSLDYEKAVEHHNPEPSIHDKPNGTFDQEPSIQEKPKKIPDQEACVDTSLLDNTSPQSLELLPQSPLLNNDYDNKILTEDTADMPKENDKDIVDKSNLFNKPLSDQDFSPGTPINNSSSQGFYFKNTNDQLQSNIENLYSSNLARSSQVMTNLNKDDPIMENKNSEINSHLNNDNDLNLIIGAVQRWKDEVVRRDYLIGELRGQLVTLRDTLEHKEHSLSHYRERMFLVESMVKRQHKYTERSRERINNVKLKYPLFRNLLYNMGKNIEEICNQKNRIENEVESMRLEFSNLTIKHKSTLDNHAAVSQTQQAQLAQITEFNAQLNNIITQLRQDIQETDSKASHFSSELDAIRLKLKHLLNERESERSAHAEKCQKLKLKFERVEEDNRNLIKTNKENEEKMTSLTTNIEREIESTRLECTRLSSIIKEKDERITQLGKAEKERDEFKVELSQAKNLAKKDLDSLRQEMEIMRAQHAIDLKRVESQFREDHYKLQNDFHKERCQLEAEWREERIRLESECREEHVHRLRLEDEHRDERSERFRIETELRGSEQRIVEISKANDKDNLRIAQLEYQLNEISRRQTDSSTVAVGTTDIPGLDLQIQHNKIISELNKENFDNKKKIDELISELETWKSKFSSLESQSISLNLKYDELQNKHSRFLVEISDKYLQNKEVTEQALNRAANNYQDMVKRINIEHENEIRKRDCKILEAETKEASLTGEIQVLKSKLSEMEDCNNSLQHQLQSLQDSLERNISGKTEINLESKDSNFKTNKTNENTKMSTVPKSISDKEYGNSRFTEILKNEHYHNTCRLLTLTEIDAMILESTSSQSKDNQNTQYMESNSNNTLTLQETERISQNVTIQAGHNNDIIDFPQIGNSAGGDIDDWLSPNSNLKSKRRKRSSSESMNNSEHISAPSTNISDVKEESKLGARFRFRGKSKVGRRFTIGRVNGKE